MDVSRRVQYTAVLSAILLTACASHEISFQGDSKPILSFDDSLFGDRPDIISPDAIFELTDTQQRDFFEYFDDSANGKLRTHERVHKYLELVTQEFDFHSDTRTAADTLGQAEGNCLSLAVLTTALANLVDVQVDYQLVESAAVFSVAGNVVTKGQHVRSLLYDPQWPKEDWTYRRGSRGGIQVDYFPDGNERFVGNLSYADYVAMYYTNTGGEAVIAGDLDTAFWLLMESLKIAPENAGAMNTLAVVYRRAGDEKMAERIYQYGIDHLPEKVTFLRNYRAMLRGQGRMEEAESISGALARLEGPNPIDWVIAGREAYAAGEYQDAVSFYKKATRIAPYLHEAYAGMALSYLQLGDSRRGENELRRALDHAQRRSARSLYQAKLMALGSLK